MHLRNLPEKTADIWRCYHWFPREKASEKHAQKFHTDDASLPDLGSASDWMQHISNQSEALPRSG